MSDEHEHIEEAIDNIDLFEELEIYNVFKGKITVENINSRKASNQSDRFLSAYKVEKVNNGHHFKVKNEFIVIKSGDLFKIKFTNVYSDDIENAVFQYRPGTISDDLKSGDSLVAWRVEIDDTLHYIQIKLSADGKKFTITFYDKAKNHYGDVHGGSGG